MTYTIKDMSELTGLAASTLRYYDNQGLLPYLRRDRNNTRIFTDDDYRALKIIECLKKSGLSIKEIKSFMNMAERGNDTLKQRLEIFTKRRDILREDMKKLQEVMNMIEYKCWYYEQAYKNGNEESVKNLSLSETPKQFREARENLHTTIKKLEQ